MGLQEIRNIKEQAKEPKIKKVYSIPKISEKRKKQIEDGKVLLQMDKEFYLEVWNSSPHICQCGCKKYLGKEMLTIFMHHLLPKAKYPQFRHAAENIMILAPGCHAQVETDISKRPQVVQRRKEVEKLLLT